MSKSIFLGSDNIHTSMTRSTRYEDIFGSVDQQLIVIGILSRLMELREDLLDKQDSLPVHNWEPYVVTWNYKNIRSLRVGIWSQEFPLSYLVQPLERLKYIKDLVQMHLTFEGIGPKM